MMMPAMAQTGAAKKPDQQSTVLSRAIESSKLPWETGARDLRSGIVEVPVEKLVSKQSFRDPKIVQQYVENPGSVPPSVEIPRT